MKKKEMDFQVKCIEYSDMSSENDDGLQLISSLLLKANYILEIKEVKTLGYLLR